MDRRDFLRIGGLGLCGVGALDLIRAQASPAKNKAKAKHLIVCWLGGGPPHLDMFDMKPDAPEEYRGLFKPIQTKVTGLQVGELLPEMAKRADKYTVIRSVSTLNKPGDHSQAPLYWLTGNPRLITGSDEYPMYGSVVNKLRPGPSDLPTFAVLDEIDVHTHNALSRSFLGSAHSPFVMQPLKDKDAVTRMLTPQLDLPAFDKNAGLLKKLDTKLRHDDSQDELIAGLDQDQQTAFNLLRSPKLRQALDISKEPPKSVDRFTRNKPAKARYPIGDPLHFLVARRLVEAGVPVVHFNLGYWDWHGDNFTAGKQQIPMFDACLAALLDDLDDRGLLDSTIVLALGEMGRKPKIDNPKAAGAGRDHWDYAQFVIAAGGGFNRGCVVGATDKLGERVTDKFYKVESFGRTLYHLLGVDTDTVLHTPASRPVKLIAEDAPMIKEAIS
ncbi:DUF1501 domain-containing protein [Zavarzinella formosa]|uniref:DUF1501 domain-containing protein n=1 Tax=Zavarzinella formosa TaxID=360055 RepID=UPI0002D6E8B0|nr:DUF1501 domain-containing protein [Zavarzinella formosa]